VSTRAATGLLDRRRALVQARHRRRRTALLVTLAGSATIAGAWWLATGPLLAIDSVNVSGYRQPDQARVLRTVQIAARDGTMLRLPTVAVREALASSPWVADVKVHHSWLRGVDVQIVQATPVAIAITASGERLLVSDTGRVLGADAGTKSLPTFRTAAATTGAWLRGPAQRAPFEFLTAMSADTARRVRDLRIEGGVLVGNLVGGTALRLGPPRLLWAKGRALEAVLANTRIADSLGSAAYLDLSAPRQPTLGGFPVDPATDGQPEASTEGQASP